MKELTGIIGCGRAGTHLAFHLQKVGWPLCGLWDKGEQSARDLCSLTGLPLLPPEALGKEADILVLALPDDLIAPTCTDLAARGVFRPGHTVFHLSGSQPASLLQTAADAGAVIASLHPLQSFSGTLNPNQPFKGILMAVEGMPEAVTLGLRMADRLGARGISIAAESKVLYHAAAVVASNYLVTLMDFAFDLLAASGIEGENAMAFLSPLVSGTLANLHALPPESALTGPLVRGDSATLARHLEAISTERPGRAALYRELGRATLELAVRGNHLTPDSMEKIRGLLA